MNKSTTSAYSSETPQEKKNNVSRERMSPSEKTMMFLKLFARNYRASTLLPESLQGFVLG